MSASSRGNGNGNNTTQTISATAAAKEYLQKIRENNQEKEAKENQMSKKIDTTLQKEKSSLHTQMHSQLQTQNQEFQRVLLVVLLYCSIFKISFTVVFDSFYILSHLFVFVKPFFQIFSNSFFRLVFRLDVTFIYCITFLSVCQALFQDFLIFSLGLFSLCTYHYMGGCRSTPPYFMFFNGSAPP